MRRHLNWSLAGLLTIVVNCLVLRTVHADGPDAYASDEVAADAADFGGPSADQIARDEFFRAIQQALGTEDGEPVLPVYFQQQPPLAAPREVQPRTQLPPRASELSTSLSGGMLGRSLLGQQGSQPVRGLPGEAVGNGDATARATTDAGSLIGKSPAMLGIGLQRRTPIVNDPRVRGSRVGQLASSGSYWVPARIDMTTAVSQIDSHLIGDVSVIKGPYSVLYGPGLHFINADLIRSPRYSEGPQWNGSTSANFKTNGQQIYARDDVWGGNQDSGWRLGYGYANGNNYVSGNGTIMPSGYTSQDVMAAYGKDLSPDSRIEVSYLFLGQSSVQFPGQAFDIDKLAANGVDVKYDLVDQSSFDRFTADFWYNRTRFDGDAQRPGKRQMFPFLNQIDFVGFTDVDSISTGYTFAFTWGDEDSPQLTVGTDLRSIDQRLTEIASGDIFGNVFANVNSPVPASSSIDPGFFVQQIVPIRQNVRVISGLRADVVNTDVTADPATLTHLGTQQLSLASILGSSDFNRTYGLFSGYVSGELTLDENWTLVSSAGSSQRPPSLTELYAAQPFMFLIQNGLNTVTGDPQLLPERMAQVDLSLRWNYDRWRGSLNGFHGWGFNYITFENLSIERDLSGNLIQTNLKYVNTDLATFAGTDLYFEYDWNDRVTPFATLTYVDARDRTRNGQFATKEAEPGVPSHRVYGLPRGFFSGIAGTAQENLPGIYPLASRMGVRWHAPRTSSSTPSAVGTTGRFYGRFSGSGSQPWTQGQSPWAIELAARVAASQNRLATSLDETHTGGFVVWDLRGYWQPNSNVSLIAGIENFANLNYREHLDYRSPDGVSMFQPGINGYLAAELKY